MTDQLPERMAELVDDLDRRGDPRGAAVVREALGDVRNLRRRVRFLEDTNAVLRHRAGREYNRADNWRLLAAVASGTGIAGWIMWGLL